MRKDTNAPTNLTKNNRFEVLNEPSNSQRNNERHNSNNSNSKSKNRNNFQNKNTKTTKTNVVLPFRNNLQAFPTLSGKIIRTIIQIQRRAIWIIHTQM